MNNLLLELHVDDFGKVKDFYEKLGFNVVWEREPEDMKGYLVMRMDDNILCFWSGNETIYEQPYFKNFPKDTKKGFGVEIILQVENLDEIYARAKSFANILEDLIEQPWGLKDFRIEDPFGYYLRITQKHDILDKEANAIK